MCFFNKEYSTTANYLPMMRSERDAERRQASADELMRSATAAQVASTAERKLLHMEFIAERLNFFNGCGGQRIDLHTRW